MPDLHREAARWVIRADGPDGRVDHFYADTDLMELAVVPEARASHLEAEVSRLREALSFVRACIPSDHGEVCGVDACWLCAAESRADEALTGQEKREG